MQGRYDRFDARNVILVTWLHPLVATTIFAVQMSLPRRGIYRTGCASGNFQAPSMISCRDREETGRPPPLLFATSSRYPPQNRASAGVRTTNWPDVRLKIRFAKKKQNTA
jgi:hypothetical protein